MSDVPCRAGIALKKNSVGQALKQKEIGARFMTLALIFFVGAAKGACWFVYYLKTGVGFRSGF